MPRTPLSLAEVAGPLSPPNAAVPSPATVSILPFGNTSRTRLFGPSEIRNPPPGSAMTFVIDPNCAAVAAPVSPLNPQCDAGHRADLPVGRDHADDAGEVLGDEEATAGQRRDLARGVDLRRRRLASV